AKCNTGVTGGRDSDDAGTAVHARFERVPVRARVSPEHVDVFRDLAKTARDARRIIEGIVVGVGGPIAQLHERLVDPARPAPGQQLHASRPSEQRTEAGRQRPLGLARCREVPFASTVPDLLEQQNEENTLRSLCRATASNDWEAP